MRRDGEREEGGIERGTKGEKEERGEKTREEMGKGEKHKKGGEKREEEKLRKGKRERQICMSIGGRFWIGEEEEKVKEEYNKKNK